jgi:hypothetical protein
VRLAKIACLLTLWSCSGSSSQVQALMCDAAPNGFRVTGSYQGKPFDPETITITRVTATLGRDGLDLIWWQRLGGPTSQDTIYVDARTGSPNGATDLQITYLNDPNTAVGSDPALQQGDVRLLRQPVISVVDAFCLTAMLSNGIHMAGSMTATVTAP